MLRSLSRFFRLAEPAAECSWRLTGVALAAAALLADARVARGVPSGSVFAPEPNFPRFVGVGVVAAAMKFELAWLGF